MLDYLLSALNDCVWAFDTNTKKYLFISPSIFTITGYPIADFQNTPNLWDDIIDRRDHEVTNNYKNEFEGWHELTYRIIDKSGTIKWIYQKYCHFIDGQTNHQIVLSVVKDLSHEKYAQEEIVWTKNNLEALINNTEDLTWSIDREGKYVYMNTAYRKRINYAVGVMPKEGDDAYAHSGSTDEVNKKWIAYYQRALLGERYVIRHESPNPNSHQPSYFEVSFNPIYKETKDEIVGVGCFARDITERLSIEDALIEQNERLKNIASLSSHELRRPVASMIGLLNILDRENFSNPENEQIMDHLVTVSKEVDEVIRLIVNKTFMDARFPQ